MRGRGERQGRCDESVDAWPRRSCLVQFIGGTPALATEYAGSCTSVHRLPVMPTCARRSPPLHSAGTRRARHFSRPASSAFQALGTLTCHCSCVLLPAAPVLVAATFRRESRPRSGDSAERCREHGGAGPGARSTRSTRSTTRSWSKSTTRSTSTRSTGAPGARPARPGARARARRQDQDRSARSFAKATCAPPISGATWAAWRQAKPWEYNGARPSTGKERPARPRTVRPHRYGSSHRRKAAVAPTLFSKLNRTAGPGAGRDPTSQLWAGGMWLRNVGQ